MKDFIKKYMWLWEIIGAALILSLSIIVVTMNSVLAMIVGIIFIFLGLLRIVPLVQTTEDKVLKWCYGIETILEIGVGIVLVVASSLEKDNSFQEFVYKYCGYFIGAVLYLRGFTFFFGTNVRHEEYPVIYFVVHIVLITLGTAILVRGRMDMKDLAWFIFAIGMVTTLFVGYNGALGYKNYRNNEASKRTTKKVKKVKEDKDKKEAPTSDEIKEDKIEIDKIPEQEKEKDQATL